MSTSGAPTVRKMLIVDDDRTSADSLAMLLKFKGHVVRAAYSGPEALQTVRDWIPDMILIDLSMPGMSGEELCRELRGLEALKGTRLVAYTGHTSEHTLRHYEAAGFNGYLLKPIDPATVESLFDAALDK